MIKHLCTACRRVVRENENGMDLTIPRHVDTIVRRYPDFGRYSSLRKTMTLDLEIKEFRDWHPALKAKIFEKYGIKEKLCRTCIERVGLEHTIALDPDNPYNYFATVEHTSIADVTQPPNSAEKIPTIRIKRTSWVKSVIGLIMVVPVVFLIYQAITAESNSGMMESEDLSPGWLIFIALCILAGAAELGFDSFRQLAFSGWVRIGPDRIEARNGISADGPYKTFPRDPYTRITMKESSPSRRKKRRNQSLYYNVTIENTSVGKVVIGRELKRPTAELICEYLNTCCETTPKPARQRRANSIPP